jgi:3D (Asp-Asp-Asp) domain-containing protein
MNGPPVLRARPSCRALGVVGLELLLIVLLGACAAPGDQGAHDDTGQPITATATRAGPVGLPQSVEVTYYAAADNDPPGSAEIAYPNSRHADAGGTGTFADPLTLATDPREIRPGTLVYYPRLGKYFVMEDDCAPCIRQWTEHRTPHVDLWMSSTTRDAVEDCEAALSPDDPDTILVNPPPGLPIDRRALYDTAGRCWPGTGPVP